MLREWNGLVFQFCDFQTQHKVVLVATCDDDDDDIIAGICTIGKDKGP